MNIYNEYSRWLDSPSERDEIEFSDSTDTRAFYAGAKAMEKSLLADPMVVDLRNVEWPDWSKRIYFSFVGENEKGETIGVISRPKPQLVPEVGQAVFGLFDGIIIMGKIIETFYSSATVHTIAGDMVLVVAKYIKPFHPDHIGKKWEDIPS